MPSDAKYAVKWKSPFSGKSLEQHFGRKADAEYLQKILKERGRDATLEKLERKKIK